MFYYEERNHPHTGRDTQNRKIQPPQQSTDFDFGPEWFFFLLWGTAVRVVPASNTRSRQYLGSLLSNLSIKMLAPCCEGPQLILVGFRRVEFRLIRAVGLKGDKNACSDA